MGDKQKEIYDAYTKKLQDLRNQATLASIGIKTENKPRSEKQSLRATPLSPAGSSPRDRNSSDRDRRGSRESKSKDEPRKSGLPEGWKPLGDLGQDRSQGRGSRATGRPRDSSHIHAGVSQNDMELWRKKWVESAQTEREGPSILDEDWRPVDQYDAENIKVNNTMISSKVDIERKQLFKTVNSGVLQGELEIYRHENTAKRKLSKMGYIRNVINPATGESVLTKTDREFKYPAQYRCDNAQEEDLAQRVAYLSITKDRAPRDQRRVLEDYVKLPKKNASNIVRHTSQKDCKQFNIHSVAMRDYAEIEALQKVKENFERFEKPTNADGKAIVDLVFFHQNEITNLADFGDRAKSG